MDQARYRKRKELNITIPNVGTREYASAEWTMVEKNGVTT